MKATEFKPPQQRAVRVTRKSNEGATSGETTELHPTTCKHAADTKVNFDFQFGSLLEKSDEPQLEFAPLHCKESAKEEALGAHEQETDTGLVEILPAMKQPTEVTVETVELSNDIKSKPQDRSTLECDTTKQSRGAGLEEEFETKASGPEPQTLQNPPCSAHLLNDPQDNMFCGNAEKNNIEEQVPKSSDHTKGVVGVTVDTLDEKICFDDETKSQITGETTSVEPPVTKRFRKRMGMCGLGDRKRRLLFEGHSCWKAGEREEGVGAVDGENIDVLKNDTVEENNISALMDEEATAEQVLLKQDPSFLEDIFEGEGRTPLTGQDLYQVQDQPSVSAMTNDHEIETSASDNEPNLPRTGTNSGGWAMELSKKHQALYEEEKHLSDYEVTEGSGEVVKEMDESPNESAKELSYVSVGVTKEMLEGSVKVTQEGQEVLIGLEESKMEIGQHCPPVDVTHSISPSLNQATTDKPDLNGPQISMPTEDEMELEFMEHIVTLTVFPEMSDAGGRCEHTESPTTAIPENTGHTGVDTSSPDELGGPAAPPADQEKHMHCLLGQDTCDPSLISDVAKQLVYNLTMTSTELPQELDSSAPLLSCSVDDSQLNIFALHMEQKNQTMPEGSEYQDDATELVCGLIKELSSLNRTVMAAHKEMELLRRSNRPPKPPGRRCYGPRHSEM
ncbi:uncharacterized protein si:ch211-286b5.2 isoform X2 [Electrophorus electricus]|nr:uncharacterized protein si:ch211-286b5.2 isoform X2 [Electrophorus electricus]